MAAARSILRTLRRTGVEILTLVDASYRMVAPRRLIAAPDGRSSR
ncbi:MAG TPA: hypothetical protein VK964_00485 [Nocardioidaceae bacterium]|nr:hypothetical protein [Nocardioidaceae bacterium]